LGGFLLLPLIGGIAETGVCVVFAVVGLVFAELDRGRGGLMRNFGGFSLKGSDPSLHFPQ
jgi:hypothetical protein